MLLWLCCSIFRTHAYLMLEIYSKPCQLFKIYLRHIENLGTVRTVYSGICRHVQEYSAIFNDIEEDKGILRHFHILRHYWSMLSLIPTYSELCVTLAYTTVPYSEPWHVYNSRHLQKPVEHVRWLDILRVLAESEQFIQAFSRIFRDVDAYLFTLTSAQLAREGGFPCPFWKS